MERNSNLEHLWDMAMPRQNKRERALMYRSSTKPIPKAAQGSPALNRDMGPEPVSLSNLPFKDQRLPGIETFIPQADMSKYKTTTTINNAQWTPQTRMSMYDYLNKAGRLDKDMTVGQWNSLKPEETTKYLSPDNGFDYTIGNSANPGGYKYWTRDMIPGRAANSDIYYSAKKATKYPTTYSKGGLLIKKNLTKEQALAQDKRDKGKTSVRKASEAPKASLKKINNRNG